MGNKMISIASSKSNNHTQGRLLGGGKVDLHAKAHSWTVVNGLAFNGGVIRQLGDI